MQHAADSMNVIGWHLSVFMGAFCADVFIFCTNKHYFVVIITCRYFCVNWTSVKILIIWLCHFAVNLVHDGSCELWFAGFNGYWNYTASDTQTTYSWNKQVAD